MSEYVQYTTWKEKALRLLPSFFKLLPKSLQVFIEIAGDMIQDVEDQVPLLIEQSNILTATGVHLERFNNLLSVEKITTEQEVNRALLLAKVVANRSTGVINDVYNIVSILGDTTPLTSDYYPATFLLQSTQSKMPSINPDLLLKIIRSASTPINLEVSLVPDEPFGFDDDSTALGFSLGGLSEKGSEPYQTPLATPGNLESTDVTFGEITITWDSVNYATSYIVRVYNVDLEVLEFFANVGNVLTYTITDLNPMTEYDIQVKAIG